MEAKGARRLRLRFDENLLSQTQKCEGLKRCWLLLDSEEFETVAALAVRIVAKFALQTSCPNGVMLSMEGYALPPFESTCILQDRDVIRIKKVCRMEPEISRIDDKENQIVDSETGEKEPGTSGIKLLALKEFDEETEKQTSCHEEENSPIQNVTKKRKRKQSHQLHASKKKSRLIPSKKDIIFSAEDGNKVCAMHNESLLVKMTRETFSKNTVDDSSSNSSAGNVPVGPQAKKSCGQHQENGQQTQTTSDALDEKTKLPSRSARRKKAKRRWLREQAQLEKKEVNQTSLAVKKMDGETHVNDRLDQNTDKEGKFVPVVVRPGHVRFESVEGSDEELQIPVDTLQWSGTTSKKRGQKWGIEKSTTHRRDFYADRNEKFAAEDGETVNGGLIDFEKLPSMSYPPKEGGVVAYRLLELSSSWCPELSPFRVGKVLSYDAVSKRITLVPVPEHPLVSNNEEKDIVGPPMYNEDGSLEIDFTSLVDIRNLNHEKSGSMTDNVGRSGAVFMNQDAGEVPASVEENGRQMDAWEEISKALDEKKATLLQKDGWTTAKPVNSSWSRRALRGSALGPTMALLRAQNGFT